LKVGARAADQSVDGIRPVAEQSIRFPSTILRQRFERARGLPLDAQMRECIDYLQNPEVLIQEFVDAYTAVESCCDPDEHRFTKRAKPDGAVPERIQTLDKVFASGAVTVFDTEPYAFQCVAREVAPFSGSAGGPVPRLDGLDYVGRIVGPDAVGVLGVVQAGGEVSPYALFLRLITCLSELAPDAQLRAADEELWKGGLGAEPKFDLQMLLRETERDSASGTLRQLTHDLAEIFYAGVSEEWQFPDVLRNVVCLVPAPADFDEQLIVEWCV
jgi:hypothetical protein